MLNVWSILLYSEYCHLTKWTSCPIFGLKPKLQDLQKQLKVKRKESKPKTKHRLCYCCKEGNLITLALFGDRGPPKTYLFKSESKSPIN